jgi:hypothetical protein
MITTTNPSAQTGEAHITQMLERMQKNAAKG